MLVIRPVAPNDLDALLALSELTGFGLTTLPKDPDFLRRRIARSVRSFEGMGESPSGESYLFVLADDETGRVVGTSGIVSKVGGFEPFYAYRIDTLIHESAVLGVRKEIKALHLVEEHDGPAEIGSLFLHPDFRRGKYAGSGRLLSLCRFLFMAEFAAAFDPVILAEMRGVIDDHGGSAFWDAIGKHFFEIDFPKADYLSLTNKRFIADLMPDYPIYVPLLPKEAQTVIGQVHEQTRPALRLLEEEGLVFSGMVDIFEGGPMVSCPVAQVRAVRESRRAVVAEIDDGLNDATGKTACLLANTRPAFRACLGTAEPAGDGVRLSRACARALEVTIGDPIRFVAARPSAAVRSAADAHVPAGIPEEPPGAVSEAVIAAVVAGLAAAKERGT